MTPDRLRDLATAAIDRAVEVHTEGRAESVRALVQAAVAFGVGLLEATIRPELLVLSQKEGSRAVLELKEGPE